jgi:hypothetical protein
MNGSDDPANMRFVPSSGKMMSPRGRLVVALVFSLISIGLALIIVDRAFSLVGMPGPSSVTRSVIALAG